MRRRLQHARLLLFAAIVTTLGAAIGQVHSGEAGEDPNGVRPGSGAAADPETAPATCTYRTYSWSVEERRAVDRHTVEKPYLDLEADERDPNDPRCTVCREDQVEIDPATLGIQGVEPFLICRFYQEQIEQALGTIASSGAFEVVEITGYRVGRTRGPVVDGVRTQWSNHSFGTAVDINADYNGLYSDCNVSEVDLDSIRGCRLTVGGEWDPEANPERTIVAGGVVHRAFTSVVGWRWGEEIEGSVRDMMHFSLSGY